MPRPIIEPVIADIAEEKVDAVVNAANAQLSGGGGVDGAIHYEAGAHLLREACAALGGCEPGDAKFTDGFLLKARWIIHTVGPIWHGGQEGEPEILASCYRRCLEVADGLNVVSMAFPAIATGAYGYPPELAAAVCVETLMAATTKVEVIELVAFDRAQYDLYVRELRRQP